MLRDEEYFGQDFNLLEMEECLSVVIGDENDFKDLFLDLERF